MVKRLGALQTSYVEMYVPHGCARRRSIPLLSTTGGDHARDVERIRRHREFAVVTLPRTARPVGINLDSQSVGDPNRHSDSLTR